MDNEQTEHHQDVRTSEIEKARTTRGIPRTAGETPSPGHTEGFALTTSARRNGHGRLAPPGPYGAHSRLRRDAPTTRGSACPPKLDRATAGFLFSKQKPQGFDAVQEVYQPRPLELRSSTQNRPQCGRDDPDNTKVGILFG